MIIVVEGIDRVGKTTLVRKLVNAGFVDLKDEFIIKNKCFSNFADYSLGKCDSFVSIIKALDEAGKNVVIDRLHITELVYGETIRNQSNKTGCFELDTVLASMGAVLCYVKPTDINLANKLAGEDQTERHELFEYYARLSAMKKITCDYHTIDETVAYILYEAFTYDFYFASPFFNPEQVEREERMVTHLRSLGFRVFSPKENCHLDAKASQQSRKDVFNANCEAIQKSRAVFAVTDGKDVGTIWEAGYAYGINKPVLYFAETLGENKFNLMLAQSGRDVYLSQDEVSYGALVSSLIGTVRNYRGDIE